MNEETKEILEEGIEPETPETPETPEEEADGIGGTEDNDAAVNEGEEEGGNDDEEELTPEQLKEKLAKTEKALAKSQAAHASNRKKQKLNDLGGNQQGNVFNEYDNAVKTIDEQLAALSEAHSNSDSLEDKMAIEQQYRELDAKKNQVSEMRKEAERLVVIAKNLDADGREKYDNWDQVMNAVGQIAPNEINAILECETAEEAFEKATNVISAITNLGRPTEKKGRKVVKKPAPPLSKLTSTATTPVEKSPDERRESWLARRNG